jgi:peptide/nickel transport system substrate-binding protein
MRRSLAASALVSILWAAACTRSVPDSSRPVQPVPEFGGTLRAALLYDVPAGLDPQRENYNVSNGIFRCCLLRTLLSYPGLPAADGGLELQPDLATTLPEVSHDGLTWTFHLKSGLRYAPPFEDRTIVSEDIVRGLERELDPNVLGGFVANYMVIQGADAFYDGRASGIAGLDTPDSFTLVVHVETPTGHLPYLFALAATAPIPPGAAEGHDKDYGRFLVASGPYMLQGAEGVDYELNPEEQTPAAGYDPGRSMVLVRNPSWTEMSDSLRRAYPDKIEISIGGEQADLALKVERGEIDVVLDVDSLPSEIERYRTDAALRDRLFVHRSETLVFLTMNLATPPFDDVHVRRAIDMIVDKAGILHSRGGELSGVVASHIAPDSLLDNALSTFDPYATPTNGGDEEAARGEMALSQYDLDADGVCDVAVCSGVIALSSKDPTSATRAAIVQSNLERIGVDLDVRELDFGAVLSKAGTPAERVPMLLGLGWFGEFPNAVTYLRPLFHGEAITEELNYNLSLVGAEPDQLASWGYDITSVPSVDARIEACIALRAGEQASCWADVDRILMDRIVPIVPLHFTNVIRAVSDRVVSYELDQSTLLPSLDRLSLRQP